MSPRYFRLYLGKNAIYADECFSNNFIGVDFDISADLSGRLPDSFKQFNQVWVPWLLEHHPEKSRISDGLACGMTWSLAKYIDTGDYVFCPDGKGGYRVARVTGDYYYAEGTNLRHRRPVEWMNLEVPRLQLSEELYRSIRGPGTLVYITGFDVEVQRILSGNATRPTLTVDQTDVEDPMSFALESHLEDFLIGNWNQTEFGRDYAIYEDGDISGKQLQVDTGRLDILAISKDKSQLLVIELKKGKASDQVVGQILRYMDYVQEELAGPSQTVRGVIVALNDDLNIRRALSAAKADIDFYRYEVRFNLKKT